ncbi:MAG: hypothetical protein LUE99_12235 [Bacteroides sp.]|nr:hypothetical protein [Bacteroides sp.]
MSAKWFISNLSASAVLCLSLACGSLSAQEKDTVFIVKYDTVYLQHEPEVIETSKVSPSRYDRRVHRYRKHWEALIPTYTKIQYAGNMGLISLGAGWDYGKRNQWETDVYLGLLPKYRSECSKVTMTLKQNYIPWSLQIKEGPFSAEPLTCGMYLNTVFAHDFWVSEPSRYPKGYYGFSSKIRIHAFLGQRLTYDIAPKYRISAKAITFFYEISTCDLYIASAFTNKYLKPKDYLSLSFGLKLQLL